MNDADDPLALNDEIAALRYYVGEFTEREETPAALAALERVEARLHAALRTRAAILRDLGHELRTPLNAILGFSHLLREDVLLSAEQRAHTEVIHRSGEQLLALIDELTGGNEEGVGQVGFDLHYLLDDLADMLCLRAAGAEVALRIDRAPDLPRRVRTDQVRLRHLLLLLLGNVLEVPRRDLIVVRVRMDAGTITGTGNLRFEVRAPGIDLADLRLRSFVRTEAGLQTDDPARGPELAVAIANQLGGEYHVAPDQLTLTLPVGLGRAPGDPRRPTRKILGLAAGQESRRILIAEDRWQSRQLLVQALGRVGFEVREAADGREAVHLCETWRPHLVWMDMRMPGVSGIEATQQIKQSEWGAETVVIALTASAFEADEATARAAGCDDFLRKPLQLHQVFDKLTERLGVAYLYDDAPLLARVDATALHGLPAPWLSALEQACLQADVFTVARMIDFVRSQAPQAASVLSDMLEQYNYAAIIDLTRHALQAAGGGP
ncbi:response regulator [Nannocystis radixulma]|uniref:histidine kinase n=1 Tax=Nannocystis radixulma TaxID=2995305 RepID=A0ABT5BL18_9BACT|nr:hybrid sensor histidine kinase/response regulator [Nannocystis radixulma]MDC0674863.1 response regulator [Nannocystis radixulma]